MQQQTQPLLSQQDDPTAGKVSVRFCVHQEEGCCPNCCWCCCRERYYNAVQIVVPDTTTVGEFLHIVSELNGAKTEYSMAFINNFQLTNSDLIAPTIRSFENFASPIVVVPKEGCCLLI